MRGRSGFRLTAGPKVSLQIRRDATEFGELFCHVGRPGQRPVLREIGKKGKDARFKKVDRGQFTLKG